jgi:acyl-CoA synthetase (AMP-forming)/AMP-acid ligase II
VTRIDSDEFRRHIATYTVERYEAEFADRHRLADVIGKWSRENPDHVALISFDTGREYTYRQLNEVTTAWALRLVEMGFEPGDFLATFLPLTAEHVILEYACFKIGVIHAPLDLRLKGPEVVRSLGLIEPRGFVFPGRTSVADFGDIGRFVREQCTYVRHFLQFAPHGQTIDGALSMDDFAASATLLHEEAQRGPNRSHLWKQYQERIASIRPSDGAQVIYTTGSTGLPKPALLSHRNITVQNMCLAAGLAIDSQARQLVNLPPSHVGCQAEQLMTTFFAGATVVILHVFDAEKSLQAIEKYRVDTFGQIPAMYNLQWRLPNYRTYDLSSVRHALFGGQTVTRQFVEQLKQMAPLIGTGLGLTEMAGFVTYTGMTDQVEPLVSGVGWWMPVTPLSIRQPMHLDGTAGAEVPAGQTGEICFTGPQVFVEYVNNRDAYNRTVSKEGVCYTGDLGYVGKDGLVFAGRAKLVIKPKGYQVHPGQIEDHFAGLNDQVALCAAVGAPHNIFSEGIVLFVEKKTGAVLTREHLEERAKSIAGYMRPSHYVVLEPGTFPLNRVSKTDYVRLGELARSEVERLRSDGSWDA